MDMTRAFSARAEASDSSDGKDTGTVRVRSGGIVPVLTAAPASPLLVYIRGTKTLAASRPLFTQLDQFWADRHTDIGRLSQRSRAAVSG